MALMTKDDPLRRLLIDFFDLPEESRPEELTQPAISGWD